MASLHRRLGLGLLSLLLLAGTRAEGQVLVPSVQASIHDPTGAGKGSKLNSAPFEGLLRRGKNREDRAIVEFNVSNFRGARLADATLAFGLAVNNAGGAQVREFDVFVYAGKGKADLDAFAVQGKLVQRISFSVRANPATYRLTVTAPVQALLEGETAFVGVRLNPIGDDNFPTILTEPSLTLRTEAAAAAEAKIAELIRRLGDAQFLVRETATAELVKVGEAARPQLQKAARESDDAEVRQRAQHILDRLDRVRRMSGLR